MKIYESNYKGVPSVRIETESFIATYLPTEGGKLASFISEGKEYLVQGPSDKFLHLDYDGEFTEGECAGFDDMFPTVDLVTIKDGTRAGEYYNDHGEVARLSFSHEITGNALKMKTVSKRLNYSYEKTVTVDNEGKLSIEYLITNLSDDEFNCLWAGHLLVAMPEGGKIFTPFNDGDEVDLVSDIKGKLGSRGERLNLNSKKMLEFEKDPENHCYKLYFPQKLEGSSVGFEVGGGKTLLMDFSKELPYLGLWINDGSFFTRRSVGLEPCTAGYDTVYNAEARGQKSVIPAKGQLKFTVKLSVS